MSGFLWWKGASLVVGTRYAASASRVGRRWVLLSARRHGSMAVMEGRVGGGDSICSQRVSCWRTWVLVGACHCGSMAVMEGHVVGGGDSICSQCVSCWRTWVLVGTCRCGSMAVVEGRVVGGGDWSCSQRVLGYMGAGGRLVPCVDGCGGRAHGQSSWVVRTRRAASTCRVGRTWLLVGAHRRVSMLRSNLVPVQQGGC